MTTSGQPVLPTNSEPRTPRRILLPIEYSDGVDALLASAVPLAEVLGAELIVLHVWHYPSMFVSGLEPWALERLLAPIRERASTMLETYCARARKCVPSVRPLLRCGEAAVEVERAIREEKADLVVLGTHGRHGFESWLPGSVSNRVLRRAMVPVLTVPLPRQDELAG